ATKELQMQDRRFRTAAPIGPATALTRNDEADAVAGTPAILEDRALHQQRDVRTFVAQLSHPRLHVVPTNTADRGACGQMIVLRHKACNVTLVDRLDVQGGRAAVRFDGTESQVRTRDKCPRR